MSREEMQKIHDAYRSKFGGPLTSPPLDFGVRKIDDKVFYGYAKAAIASGKPINWREILGPTLHERDPSLVS